MYNEITKILEKSKETGKDIGVAYDLLRAEEGQSNELKKASDFLEKNQVAILKLLTSGNEDEIKKLCEISEDNGAVERYIRNLYNRGIIK